MLAVPIRQLRRCEGGAPVRYSVPYAAPSAVIDLGDKLAQVDAHWSPYIVGAFNGHDLRVVNGTGAFVWHFHPDMGDLFLVLKGSTRMEIPGETVHLGPGQLIVVPRGASIARSSTRRPNS